MLKETTCQNHFPVPKSVWFNKQTCKTVLCHDEPSTLVVRWKWHGDVGHHPLLQMWCHHVCTKDLVGDCPHLLFMVAEATRQTKEEAPAVSLTQSGNSRSFSDVKLSRVRLKGILCWMQSFFPLWGGNWEDAIYPQGMTWWSSSGFYGKVYRIAISGVDMTDYAFPDCNRIHNNGYVEIRNGESLPELLSCRQLWEV